MPGIQDLLALAGGGGGGGAPPAPQGGAPMPQGGGNMGGAIQQVLGRLMQDPVARQAMMQHASANGMPGVAQAMGGGGGDPRAMMAAGGVPPSGFDRGRSEQLAGAPQGRGVPMTDGALMDTSRANQDIRGNLPIQPSKDDDYVGFTDEVRPMDDPRQTPEAMVEQEMDRKGATFDGNKAPTENDIDRLKEDPSPVMMKMFDEQFGPGAAKIIVTDSGDTEEGKVNPQYDEEAGETSGDSESKEY